MSNENVLEEKVSVKDSRSPSQKSEKRAKSNDSKSSKASKLSKNSKISEDDKVELNKSAIVSQQSEDKIVADVKQEIVQPEPQKHGVHFKQETVEDVKEHKIEANVPKTEEPMANAQKNEKFEADEPKDQKVETPALDNNVDASLQKSQHSDIGRQELDDEIDQEFTVDDEGTDEEHNEHDDNDSNHIKEHDDKGTDGEQKKKVKKVKKKTKKSFNLCGLQNQHMDQYNGLKDEFLQNFFCSDQRKKHLVKMGMVTKEGYVVNKPEEYLRKKALYNKLYGLENKEKKGKRSKTFNKKVKNPYASDFDTKIDKPLKDSKKTNVEAVKRG